MKTIVWKTENVTKRSASYQTLRVTAVVVGRGKPKELGSVTDQFASDTQMLMELLESKKILPPAAFERNQYGGHKHMPHTLETAGFARCVHL